MSSAQLDDITKIIAASEKGDIETLQSVLTSADNPGQLVQSTNKYGETALHCACNRDIAQVLVEAVPPDQREQFLLKISSSSSICSNSTALHTATWIGCNDVVEYLCSLEGSTPLALCQDGEGNTPLHVAHSRQVAELLVQSVPSELKETLLMAVNKDGRATLHEIIQCNAIWRHNSECADMVSYYLEQATQKQNLLRNRDLNGSTALHDVGTREIAQLLLHHVQDSSEYINMKNSLGRTALHTAANKGIAELLIEQIKNAEEISAYVSITDNSGQTALHTAKDDEIAKLLIDSVKAQEKSSYVGLTDHEGRTALFYSENKLTKKVLINAANDPLAYILHKDHDGDTALTFVVSNWNKDALLQYFLEYLSDNHGEVLLRNILLTKNRFEQNILHLISLTKENIGIDSECFDGVILRILEFSDESTIAEMLTPDVFGNNPLHYLAARLDSRTLHDICMQIPMWLRKRLLSQRRDNGVCPRSILDQHHLSLQLYMEGVFEGSGERMRYVGTIPSSSDTVDSKYYIPSYRRPQSVDVDTLCKVMKYVLNEYPLSHFSPSRLREEETTERHSAERTLHQQVRVENLSQTKLFWLSLEASIFSHQEMQRKLYGMDIEDKHGKLKVVVASGYTSTPTQFLSPPGPDYLIISVVGDNSSQHMFPEQSLGFTDVDVLLDELTNTPGVQYINVNSTMSKHYGSSTEVDTDYTLVNGGCGGKALIICNKTRRPDWETEHEHAVYVLERQLGLQVTTLWNQSVEDMKREVETFARSCDQTSMVVLSIMSHGDEKGNIFDDGGKNVITVQEVVDALCQQQIEHVTKLVLLTFCRGSIGRPRHNRAYKSWEYTQLPQLTDFVASPAPVRQGVRMADLEEVRRTHPFPSVDVPSNCYILYSTLPDSKSFRYNSATGDTNWMFRGLREYIAEFCDNYVPTDLPTNSTTQAIEQGQCSVNLAEGHTKQPHVGLLYLFTEVACTVRQESGATQVLHLCYARGKGYKAVHVQLLP